jgi:hypothetical protein
MSIGVGFFDESTDGDTEGVCYVVAGFIGSNAATAVLELRWWDLLAKYNLRYFKASECSAGEGEFRQYRDDPQAKGFSRFSKKEKEKLDEIKTAFTDAIVNSDGIAGIGAAIILPDYERIRLEYPAVMLQSPYFLCANLVLMEAGVRVCIENEDYKDHDKVWVRPVFDSHEEYSGRMKQGFDWFCLNNPISARYLLPPYYEDDCRYLTLQAADNLAFEIRKLAIGERKNIRERISLTRLKDSGSILKVYKLNYDSMKTLVEAHDPEFTLKPLSYTLADIIEDI